MTAAVFYDFAGETVEAARHEGLAGFVQDSDGANRQPVAPGDFLLYRREEGAAGVIVRLRVVPSDEFLGRALAVAVVDRTKQFGLPTSAEQAAAFDEGVRQEIDRQRQARAEARERSKRMVEENEGDGGKQPDTAGLTDPTGQLSAGPEGVGTAQPAHRGGGEDPLLSNNTDLVAKEQGTAMPPRNDADPKPGPTRQAAGATAGGSDTSQPGATGEEGRQPPAEEQEPEAKPAPKAKAKK